MVSRNLIWVTKSKRRAIDVCGGVGVDVAARLGDGEGVGDLNAVATAVAVLVGVATGCVGTGVVLGNGFVVTRVGTGVGVSHPANTTTANISE